MYLIFEREENQSAQRKSSKHEIDKLITPLT